MFKLVIQDDEGKTTVVPLVRDEITIGRKEGNTIRLTERNVSRRHARIVKSNDEVQIEDLGSYNGIRVNNSRIAARAALRVSDQVQIGDYKLFLKTEAIGGIAGNSTVPIDRHHEALPTEVMAAVNIATEPVPTLQGLGQVEIEPAVQQVVTAAPIPTLTPVAAAPGYGRLVVVSSNLAGKEFELARSPMIIGRTDDNDLIVNHRSISRNHARITRDPNTQRYTISDLQSANGVRVNDQDFAKVELRRGDIVDLGHVRMRFIEPGEDFVFGRDAILTDVPDEGGRRGLAIAVVLAMMVLGAAGALVWLKTHERPEAVVAAGDSRPAGGSDGGSSATMVQPIVEDAAAVAAVEVDAGSNEAVDPAVEAKRVVGECLGFESEAKWSDLTLCADKLAPLDKAAADKFKAKVSLEIRANIQKDKMETELAAGSLTKAKTHLAAIPDDSIAKQPSQAEYDRAEQRLVEDFKTRAAKAKRAGKCADIDVLATQANAQSSRAAAEVRAFKCETPLALDCSTSLKDAADKKCLKQFCASHDADVRCGGPPPCDTDALLRTAENSVALGQHKEALANYEDALRCRYDSHTVELAYMEACNTSNPVKARIYWKKLSPERQNSVVQICTRNHITRDLLDAP